MFGRQLRSRLDLLKPSLESRVEHNQQRQKGHDQHARERQFSVSDSVYVRNFGQGEVWFPGVISEVTGPVSYTTELTDGSGKTVRRHQDHVWRHHDVLPETLLVPEPVVEPVSESQGDTPHVQRATDTTSFVPQSQEPERRYPVCQIYPPERFM